MSARLTLTQKRAISVELHRCRETLRENRLVLDVLARAAVGDYPRKRPLGADTPATKDDEA